MSQPSEPTYQTFVLHQILPPLGWQAVFVYAGGVHEASPVALLALVTRRYRDTGTRRLLNPIHATGAATEEEGREVVALDYESGGTGFTPCDELDNYCGLLPPDMTMLDFLATHQCPHQHAKENL